MLSAKDFPVGSDDKASAHNVGDLGLIPESGRPSGEGNVSPLQYSCLENPMTEEPGRLQSMKSQSHTTKQLNLSLPRTHSDAQSFLYADLNLPIGNHLFILINSVSPVSSELSSLYFYNLHVFVYTLYH